MNFSLAQYNVFYGSSIFTQGELVDHVQRFVLHGLLITKSELETFVGCLEIIPIVSPRLPLDCETNGER